jgi:hypothetical protein
MSDLFGMYRGYVDEANARQERRRRTRDRLGVEVENFNDVRPKGKPLRLEDVPGGVKVCRGERPVGVVTFNDDGSYDLSLSDTLYYHGRGEERMSLPMVLSALAEWMAADELGLHPPPKDEEKAPF